MKIAWIVEKCLDTSIDHTTWTEMVRQLKALGHDVQLYAGFRERKENFSLGNSIHYLPSIKKPVFGLLSVTVSIFFILFFLNFVKKPDIIILHPSGVKGLWPFILLKKIKLITPRWVLDIRTLPVEVQGFMASFQHWEFKKAIHSAKSVFDGITVITPFMRHVVCHDYDINKKRVGYWTSGAMDSWVEDNTSDDKISNNIREKLGLDNKFVFMYHGAMSPNRGLENIVYAIDKIRHEEPDIHCILLGDGAVRKEFEILIHKTGCTNYFTLINPIPHKDVKEYLECIDAGIIPLPALIEWRVSSPIKLMEYLATGNPVVVTDIEAHRDVLGESAFAYYYQPDKPALMQDALIEIMKSKDNLKAQGLLAAKLIKEHYTWSSQAARLELFLQNLLK